MCADPSQNVRIRAHCRRTPRRSAQVGEPPSEAGDRTALPQHPEPEQCGADDQRGTERQGQLTDDESHAQRERRACAHQHRCAHARAGHPRPSRRRRPAARPISRGPAEVAAANSVDGTAATRSPGPHAGQDGPVDRRGPAASSRPAAAGREYHSTAVRSVTPAAIQAASTSCAAPTRQAPAATCGTSSPPVPAGTVCCRPERQAKPSVHQALHRQQGRQRRRLAVRERDEQSGHAAAHGGAGRGVPGVRLQARAHGHRAP